MTIEFDPEKDVANVRKHGISLASAELLDWETIQVESDARHDYGETRQIGYGFLNNRLHAIVFTYRGLTLRVISLRKANKRERKKYGAKKNPLG